MKLIKTIFAILALSASAAFAEGVSITLDPTPLCSAGFCYNVPNSAGVVIGLSVPPKYWWVPSQVYVSINGDAYVAEVPPYTYGQFNLSGVVLTDAAGSTITVSETWQGVRKCSSGRAGGCSTVYELVSGTVLIP